jgi:catechol 2,3-dioxygenase-like lactoylglutathione lyase family enzyme
MTLAIHHLAVNAHDASHLARLYGEGAGFRPVEGRDRWIAAPNAFLGLQRGAGAITDAQRGRRVCDPGITHFCIQSGDGEGLWRRMSKAGLAFNSRPVALGTGAIYAYGRDAECNVIETEGVGDAETSVPPWIAHVALCTPDLERLTDFYGKLIGRPAHHRGTYSNPLFEQITGLPDVEVSAAWIMTDNMILELWRYHNPPTLPAPPLDDGAPGYRHIGFVAENLTSECDRLEAAGVTLTEAEFDGLQAAEGVDPEGNRFLILAEPGPDHPLSLSRLADPEAVTRRHRHLLPA